MVFEASHGAEAVDAAREILPDLVVVDLHMPVLDGLGVLQALRRDQRFVATPIVALTASAMRGDRERAFSGGFTDYISKPISLVALRKKMGRLLGKDVTGPREVLGSLTLLYFGYNCPIFKVDARESCD
jgi:CheY-like chemotaxis protein